MSLVIVILIDNCLLKLVYKSAFKMHILVANRDFYL